jgi:hypothetical protein
VALSSLPSTADSAFVSAVDPRDPAVLYVRTLEGLSSALYRSADGGATLQPVLRFAGTMDGFALDATGQTVWVGGPSDGLHRSDDGGRTFTQISPRGVFCLHHRAGALYACADWVTGAYALGRSTDGGGRFETVLRFESVDGAVACGPSQRAGCDAQWPTFAQFFQRRDADASVPVPPRDAARPMPRDVVLPSDVGPRDAGVDAAAVPPEVPAARGCGCVAAPPTSRVGAGVCALLVGVSCLRRRRRRPSQAPTTGLTGTGSTVGPTGAPRSSKKPAARTRACGPSSTRPRAGARASSHTTKAGLRSGRECERKQGARRASRDDHHGARGVVGVGGRKRSAHVGALKTLRTQCDRVVVEAQRQAVAPLGEQPVIARRADEHERTARGHCVGEAVVVHDGVAHRRARAP